MITEALLSLLSRLEEQLDGTLADLMPMGRAPPLRHTGNEAHSKTDSHGADDYRALAKELRRKAQGENGLD